MTQAFNLSQFANNLNSSGQVSAAGLQTGVTLPSGTVSLYYQASAPTGWTQVTSLNDYALRVVSGTGGSTGGTTAFSTVFSNQTPTINTSAFSVAATTLSIAQMPSHNHVQTGPFGSNACPQIQGLGTIASGGSTPSTAFTGGGGSHTHTLSGSATSSTVVLNVLYASIILCAKN